MAKKYSNADLKSLKRDEIAVLLKKEGIDVDVNQSLFVLRKLLLDLEVEDKPENAEGANEDKPENVENAEGANEDKPEEPAEKTEAEKKEASAAFQSELSKRMATFGRATQSAFSIELARRQGKRTGRVSFAEELKLRQNKVRR
jgi:hypothetical protein